MRPGVFRVKGSTGDSVHGTVCWAPAKSVWINSCLVAFIVLAPAYTTWSSVLMFVALTYATLLLGHSVGMHRKLIHRTYDCPKWLEYLMVYLGVLVGMGGPIGIVLIHDVRDWAQREPDCHDFFSHRRGFWRDALWQLNARFEFDRPPEIHLERGLAQDPVYRFLQRTWMAQQLPLALLLYTLGGAPWVVWGIFGRVFVSVAGHWTITYLTHNPGPGRWWVPDAGVQASNLPGFGLVTLGECWHNNHHAFPESARIGLEAGEVDPGWWVICALERGGLVWNVGMPRVEARRDDLRDTQTGRSEKVRAVP